MNSNSCRQNAAQVFLLHYLIIFGNVSAFTPITEIQSKNCRNVRSQRRHNKNGIIGTACRKSYDFTSILLGRRDRSTLPLNLFIQQKQGQKEMLVDNDKSKNKGMDENENKMNNKFGSNGRIAQNVETKQNVEYMDDLAKFLKKEDDDKEMMKIEIDSRDSEDEQSLGGIITSAALVFAAAGTLAVKALGISLPEASIIITTIQHFFADPNTALENVVDKVESMGALGFIYFGVAYTIAEILAIPAIPLTASAGYLFGVRDGTIVVLISASIAAAVSFLIGRTFLRKYVEKALENYPDFKKIDRAIGEEGFKLMLLLRISPIFPFALSNYFYGATKIGFWAFFFGTMIGFTPGTIAYVYTGEIGKSLTIDAGSEPWYVYLGLLALFSGFLKIIADVATGVIQKIDNMEEYD